ncbi:DUF2812 domain-containing protein [Anaerobacillus sp. CMMVII]|uniref:DUF2812 domain-containing protein n=1 Tax=Anaerobacillus sp. CMMVII TaxID=2755588 RepID=UPI0021B74FF0|nr:DUF2812 domain-containing protein [Anaerobacillus sp. CMMVII]MCT8139178.1 DUF2812 domain-containing protein [Anaerobacillus sp. CMMVII]
MGKFVRKLRPRNYWRIGEHECWFSDMAAEGLHLKKMGIHFAQFVKGEPKKTKYRIDVSKTKKITTEQKLMYAECGWNFVTSYGLFNVFSSPAELNAPELHTDPAEQAYTLKELDKKFTLNALLTIFATILIVGMHSSIWFLDATPTLAFVDGMIVQQTIITFFMIYLAYTSLQAAVSIRSLRKKLLEGKPLDHHAPWRKHQKRASIISILYIIVLLFVSILPFVQLIKMDTKTLPVTTDLPIVRLADVEQNPHLVLNHSPYIVNNVDWSNRYSYSWSLLAPIQYDTNEEGLVPNQMWQDDSGEYSPSIDTRVYQLRFPSMANSLISDLVKRYSFAYRGATFLELEHTDFDSLIVYEEDETKELFASKGKAVIHVRYYGYAEINTLIQNTAKKIALISE